MFDVGCYYKDNREDIYRCVSYKNDELYKFQQLLPDGSIANTFLHYVRNDGSFCYVPGRRMISKITNHKNFNFEERRSMTDVVLEVGKCYKDNYDIVWVVLSREKTSKNDYYYFVKRKGFDNFCKVLSNGWFGVINKDDWFNPKRQIIPIEIDPKNKTQKETNMNSTDVVMTKEDRKDSDAEIARIKSIMVSCANLLEIGVDQKAIANILRSI